MGGKEESKGKSGCAPPETKSWLRHCPYMHSLFHAHTHSQSLSLTLRLQWCNPSAVKRVATPRVCTVQSCVTRATEE